MVCGEGSLGQWAQDSAGDKTQSVVYIGLHYRPTSSGKPQETTRLNFHKCLLEKENFVIKVVITDVASFNLLSSRAHVQVSSLVDTSVDTSSHSASVRR